MSTDIMYFTFSPKNAQFFYEKSVIMSGFWTAHNIFFTVYIGYVQSVYLILQSNLSEMKLRVLHRLCAVSFSKFAIKFVRNEIEGTT